MTQPTKIQTPPAVLLFEGQPVRAFTSEAGAAPYFSLFDLRDIFGWTFEDVAPVTRSSFPSHARKCFEVTGEHGPRVVTTLSAVGVFLFAGNDSKRGEKLANWARCKAYELCPEPREGDPAMFLTPSDYGELPPKPLRYSGWIDEWRALSDSEAHRASRRNSPIALFGREMMERQRGSANAGAAN